MYVERRTTRQFSALQMLSTGISSFSHMKTHDIASREGSLRMSNEFQKMASSCSRWNVCGQAE